MFAKLQILGRDLLLDILPNYIKGELKGEVQNEEEVTYAWNIKHEEEEIDWNKSSREIFNHIRGLYPSPATFTYLDGEVVKVFVSEIIDETSELEPGLIVNCKKGITVACGKGLLKIKELQVSGKKRMDAQSYLNGAKLDLVNKKLG
jgi:methionyl-tRNA formyltransferase